VRLFLDSSALTKRYVEEAGSDVVLAQCRAASEIVMSLLAVPEVLSALNRLRRAQALRPVMYRRLKAALLADADEASIIDVTPAVVATAVRCLERTAVRTLDALQIASAVEGGAEVFLSADRRQLLAARVMGLNVTTLPPG
jgi:uncharacterized protein